MKATVIIPVVLIMLSGSFLYLSMAGTYGLENDESGFLYSSWRISEGDVPYRDVPLSQTPLVSVIGATAFKLFGATANVARILTMAFAVCTAAVIYFIGKEVHDCRAGLIASILFITNKAMHHQAVVFMSEAYCIFFSALAIFVFLRAYRRNNKMLILASGAVFGMAFLSKVLGLLSFAGVMLFLLYAHLAKGKSSGRGVVYLFGGFFLTTILSFFVLYLAGANPYENIAGRFVEKAGYLINPDTVRGLVHFFAHTDNLILLALSLPTMAFNLVRRKEIENVFSFQLLMIFAFFFVRYPSWEDRHFLVLLPAMTILASRTLSRFLGGKGIASKLVFLIVALILLNALFPRLTEAYHLIGCCNASVYDFTEANGGFVDYITDNTADDDYVLIDYYKYPFLSKRKQIPLPYEIAGYDVTVGLLPSDIMIERVREHEPRLIMIRVRGHPLKLRHMPDYDVLEAYLLENYVKEENPGFPDWDVYLKSATAPRA